MSQPEDETQLENQTEETQDIETQELESGNLEEETEVVAVPHKKKKPEKKDAAIREPGKTLFPMSRVQKIIKADKVQNNMLYIYDGLICIIIRKYQLLQKTQLS